jgi:hypothetical protein
MNVRSENINNSISFSQTPNKVQIDCRPNMNMIYLIASWLFAFMALLTPSMIPAIFSVVASIAIIINQYQIYKKSKDVGKTK